MLARTLSMWFAAWMALLTVAFYLWPGMHMLWWGAIGLSSTAGVVVGVLVHKPRSRWPWLLLATALLAFGAGDFLYNLYTDVFGWQNPFPSIPDLLYLAMYPLVAGGLLGFIRSRTGRNNRDSLLDAATLTIGLALLSWIFLIDPYVRSTELTLVQKVVSIAYPLGDVLTIAVFVRLLTGGVRRNGAINFLGLGTAGLLVADVAYGLLQLNGSWHVGGPTDLGWVLCYFGWAAAALHPSMVRLTEPTRSASADLGSRRIALLAAASLISPGTLLIEASLGTVRDAAVIATSSGVMFVLVLTRLAGVMGNHRQSMARERELREATTTLLSAADATEALSAVRHALVRLLPDGTPHTVVLVRAEQMDAPGLVRVSGLAPDLRAQLREFSSVLRHPFGVENDMLYLAAPTEALQALQATFEVLASQAAMALERITLTAEVNRRNSEAYFRTLIHNTSDVILIVDENDVIQYASPSAGTVFGDERLAGYELWEFTARDERPRLAELLAQVRGGLHGNNVIDLHAERVDGTGLLVEVDCRDLRGDQTVGGLVLTVRDVTERCRLEEQLIRQAFHDSLTGLANRVLFQDRVEQSVARAERDGSLVGVLFIDLDDFKIVNDTLGHAVGDALLKAVGERVTAAVRTTDTARLGGDEFAALIETESMADLELAAERIVIALAEQFNVGGDMVNGISSIGLSTTVDASSAEELMRQADLALYVAKGAGKGQWRRYQAELHMAVLERLELRAALDQAVSSSCSTSRSLTWRPACRWASRRSCAGTTRPAA